MESVYILLDLVLCQNRMIILWFLFAGVSILLEMVYIYSNDTPKNGLSLLMFKIIIIEIESGDHLKVVPIPAIKKPAV